ncbi:hypothetical protein BsWGS_16447 [Bradybaena similaris]
MYRPTFPLMSVNQIDVQMTSKTVTAGHTSPMPLGPALCEDGHPFVSDPVTGRKMCTCSLGLEVTYDPRSVMADARKQGMSLSGTIGSPSVQLDTSAFYPPLIRGIPVRQDRLPPYLTSGMPGQPLNFDSALAGHPYGLLYAGMDVNGGPIRKAATRETTGPLKIWLSEHKKNPYPTKAEKIMLAIITRMTLTQVSTWFANARRRLKKENKLYPADRENRDDDDDDEDFGSGQREGNTSQSAGSEKRTTSESDADDINVDMSDCSDDDDNVILTSTVTELDQHSLHKIHQGVPYDEIGPETESGQGSSVNSDQDQWKICQSSQGTASTAASPRASPSSRPKIWSISEIINGSSTTKDSQGLKAQSILTNTSLTKSRHEFQPPSILLIPETSLSVPFVHTSPSLPPSPFSPSSSSLISPTAFRPFSSVIGSPTMLRHRPELSSFVSKHGLPVSGKSSPFDRHASAAAIKPHLVEANVTMSPVESTLSESVSTCYDQEEAAEKTKLNKNNDIISKKDKRETDAKNLQLPKTTHLIPASMSQPTNILRCSSESPTKPVFSNDASRASSSCRPQPERPRNLGKLDQHTNQSGQ